MQKIIKIIFLTFTGLMINPLCHADYLSKLYIQTQAGLSQQSLSDINPINKYQTAGRLSAGIDFNKYIGTEIGYLYTPSTDWSNEKGIKFSTKTGVADLFLKFQFPFTHKLNLYSKLGGAAVGTSYENHSNTPNLFKDSVDLHLRPATALGVGYKFNDKLSANLSWEYIFGSRNKTSEYNESPRISFTSLGLSYHFGG